MQIKAIVGGLAIDPVGSTFARSIILVAGSHLHAVGSDPDVSVPPGSMSWSADGRYIVPAPIEMEPQFRIPLLERASDAKAAMMSPPAAMEGVLSEEHEFPRQLAETLARRDTIVVPRLARLAESPLHLSRGLRHVRTLKENKVRLASFGDKDSMLEWRLLSQAGLTPRQILETTTVHAAEVAQSHRETGSLRVGYLANLWILRNDPLVDAAHLASVEGIMQQGAWQGRTGPAV